MTGHWGVSLMYIHVCIYGHKSVKQGSKTLLSFQMEIDPKDIEPVKTASPTPASAPPPLLKQSQTESPQKSQQRLVKWYYLSPSPF